MIRTRPWRVVALLGAALLALDAHSAAAAVPAGESIYRLGVLPSGTAVTAQRAPDLKIFGADTACSNCHRRSGLGELEGRISIPPISGPYLFHPRASNRDDFDLPFVDTIRPDRDPYTEATLARAIREGIDAGGHRLGYLMPRYTLDDADMTALIAYLRTLTPAEVPGVTAAVLHFATIITPDADPARRAAMLDVLNHFFADKDAFSRAESARLRSSHRMMFKANRKWMLHVWEPTGPADTWEAQLRADLAHEPVFAVISGLGGRNWAPVHHFCEQAALPCLFANVDLPVVAEGNFYSLYFTRGVLLEADLIAHQIAPGEATHSEPATPAVRVVQLYRSDDIGAAAAAALRASLAASGIEVVDRPLAAGAHGAALAAASHGLRRADTLVLWLRPDDLAALGGAAPASGSVYASGLMGGLSHAPLPGTWRPVTRMAYPFDLPQGRRIRMDYPLGWFHLRQIPVVDERVQADTYLACGLLAETLSHMSDSFIRDYLVERTEAMLEHRILTAYYPRLALAPNQRFASKGGYIVHFAAPAGTRLVADSDWIVP